MMFARCIKVKVLLIICGLLVLVMGCASHRGNSKITKLDKPILRENNGNKYTSVLNIMVNEKQSASIGDELFRITRRFNTPAESVRVKSSTYDSFPHKAIWKGTHLYHDDSLGDLIVYTTPAFYKGTLGVILDSKGHLATFAPIIQVKGNLLKRGRRWKVNGTGQFFTPGSVPYESWGVRYGGLIDNVYIFEILNKNEANVIEIIQTIKITPKAFFDGFVIRKVFIEGLGKDINGIIKYKVYDKFDTYKIDNSSKSQVEQPSISNTEKRINGSGTGFIITKDGYIVTCHHVIKDANEIKIIIGGSEYPAKLVRDDPNNDLALLKINGSFPAIAFSPNRSAKMGQEVFTIGYPNPSLQGVNAKITKGTINSLTGFQDDLRLYQVSVPVQPGNSGGALLNENGNILGIIVAMLSAKTTFKISGSLPQNVNYAVKSMYAQAMLDTLPEVYNKLLAPSKSKSNAVERVKKSTVMVLSYQ